MGIRLDRRRGSRAPITIALGRLVLNLPARIFYPFLPAIGRALGVSLATTSLVLTARALASAASPLYGMLADRWGRRALMLAGLACLVGGCLLALFAPGFGALLVAFALLGTSKASYDPAMLAYFGDTVPYERRARIVGLLEMAWPAAWLLGVPAAGLMIGAFGWRSPFALIGILGTAALILTWRLPWRPKRASPGRGSAPRRPAAFLKGGWLTASALGALAVNLLQVMANENVFIVYGAWMEGQFGLSVKALGVASIVICVAEFAAEGATAGLADRIGKRRAVLAGLFLSVTAYCLLPRLAVGLVPALAGIFYMTLAFDFSIVTMLSLISELAPTARATLMALNVAALAAARLVSSLVAPRLWSAGGLPLTVYVSAGLAALALLVLWLAVREREAAAYPALSPS